MTLDLADDAADRRHRVFHDLLHRSVREQRAKLVPAAAIAEMQQDGAGFAGFATWLDMTPAHPDMFAMPDPASLIQLPWKPEVGLGGGRSAHGGQAVAQAPRDRAEARQSRTPPRRRAMSVKTGVEASSF